MYSVLLSGITVVELLVLADIVSVALAFSGVETIPERCLEERFAFEVFETLLVLVFLESDCADANPAMHRKNTVEKINFFIIMHFAEIQCKCIAIFIKDHRINTDVPFICRGCLVSRSI